MAEDSTAITEENLFGDGNTSDGKDKINDTEMEKQQPELNK